MKKKPIVTILVILLIMLGAYFVFWNMQAKKVKTEIEQKLSEVPHKSVSISGFPFFKTVKIKDIEFKSANPTISQDSLKIKEIKASSFVLGNQYDVSFKGMTYISKQEGEYSVEFQRQPKLSFSLYKNGKLRTLKYQDSGYKILNNKKQAVQSFGESDISIASTLTATSSDYAVKASFDNMQNFNILNVSDKQQAETLVPDSYSLKLDVSTSQETSGQKTVQINDLTLKNKIQNIQLNLSGMLKTDRADPIASGNLRAEIKNFDKMATLAFDNFMEMQKASNPQANDKDLAMQFTYTIDALKQLARKNPESTDADAVFLVERKKMGTDYKINNMSLVTFMALRDARMQKQKTIRPAPAPLPSATQQPEMEIAPETQTLETPKPETVTKPVTQPQTQTPAPQPQTLKPEVKKISPSVAKPTTQQK